MRIEIETIPHKKQRYNTCGDYWIDEDDNLQIRISDLGNTDYEFLIALHELIEAYLCLKDGIDFDKITKFDEHFEEMRKAFPTLVGEMEPGDHEKAPYHKWHRLASMIERNIADNMARLEDKDPNEYFEAYDKKVNKL